MHVRAAGINPLDAKVFQGRPTANPHTVEFPSGNGGDFAGAIDELGEGVTGWELGDEVLGGRQFFAQAPISREELRQCLASLQALSQICTGLPCFTRMNCSIVYSRFSGTM